MTSNKEWEEHTERHPGSRNKNHISNLINGVYQLGITSSKQMEAFSSALSILLVLRMRTRKNYFYVTSTICNNMLYSVSYILIERKLFRVFPRGHLVFHLPIIIPQFPVLIFSVLICCFKISLLTHMLWIFLSSHHSPINR